jgi:DNA-binding MarR family transcriptional regulator
VLALLQRPDGASLSELVEATSWLPHTTRAALTGLKKKGHVLTSAKVDDVRRYSVSGPVA